MKLRIGCVAVGFLSLALSVAAQTSSSVPAVAQVPPALIQFSNVATDERGNTLSGVVSITFSLYSGSQGGEALWTETQNNVQLDATGHYSVQLGVTKPAGVPTALFVTGAARWLGVQIEEQTEQPRVLLLSVPYALKAGDAATIGGFPPSAFVLAAPGTAPTDSALTTASVAEPSVPPPAGTVTGAGTVDFIPLWTSTSNIGNSAVFQSGTGSTVKIGINTSAPGATLDVKGGTNLEGLLTLPATGTATASVGRTSQAQDFVASSYNGGTAAAVSQTFQWRAEPLGNDTTTPSGTLSLLFGSGTASPAETGLKLNNKGLFTFATGQTFPGTGTLTGITTATGSGLTGGGTKGTLNLGLKTCAANQVLQFVSGAWTCSNAGTGTVTSVASGAGLTGGPITGSGTLSIPTAGVTNAMLANSKVTVSAGTGLTGGGAVALGGSTSLSINTALVPELGAANTFLNENTINNLVMINAANSANPALNITNSAGNGINISVPVGGYGIQISAPGAAGEGLIVENAGVFGVSGTGNYQGGYFYGASGGTYSQNDTDSDGAVAAYAFEFGTTQKDIGFWGYSASTHGVGVYGQADQASLTGEQYIDQANGVWGDTGVQGGAAVVATADDAWSLLAYNNGPLSTAYLQNNDASSDSSTVLITYGGSFSGTCEIDVSGNLHCTGAVGGVAPVEGGARKVALNAVQSPEAWFEDAGSGQLSGGRAVVNIESVFGQTINTGVEYHVFLTPNGDCKGLYVAEKSGTSFVVKELGGGTSSIAFDYRIMAKRKSFEDVRLADATKAFTMTKRPVKSAANAKHLPSAESIRKQTQEHAKRRTVAGLSGTASK
ncbi:MAG: hypothetical protein ACYDDS_21200 [Candidatus Sulfotelmatobacter sp.]|jgi:hypothetical protein